MGKRLGLFLLLLLELVYLMVAFDTQKLDTIPTFWAQVVNWAPQYLRLVISVTLATVVLATVQRRSNMRSLFWQSHTTSVLPLLAVHGCVLVLFALVTNTIVSTGAAYHAHPAIWTLSWLLTGAVTLGTWAVMVWPLRSWRPAIRQEASSISLGTAIGTTVWAAGSLTEDFWIPLARYTFNAVAWVLSFFYAETVNRPARLLIGTRAFKVVISPQCSGYEGVGLILVFLAVYLWLFRKDLRFPSALILLPIGAITIWIANVLRIVALIAIGTAGWPAVALGGFHSQAGWIAFNAIALGFVAITNRLGYFKTPAEVTTEHRASSDEERTATVAYLAPFLVITATAMLTGAFAAGFDWLYPVRVVVTGVVLWACRKHYGDLKWRYSWWSFAIGFITFVIWLALAAADTNRNSGWPAAMQSIPLHWAATWMLIRSIGYIVMTPLAEELAFRGFLTRRLLRADFQNLPVGVFSWSSFVLSSVLFGAFHGSLWLPGTIAGVCFALALYRRQALGDAVWAHATTNGLIALYAWATGRWWVWS